MARIISLLVLAVAVCVSAQPAPPVIPLQWQAGTVQVFWSVNQTTPIEAGGRMYWDYTVDSIRTDSTLSGATFIEIDTYSDQTEYEIMIGTWANNQPACTKKPSQGSMASRYILQDATYAGQEMKNDVMCDVWWVIIPHPAPQPAENLTMWWNTPMNAPVEWSSIAVDGSQVSIISLFQFQPNVNVPGNGLFAIPPLCSSDQEPETAVSSSKPAAQRPPKMRFW